MKKQELYEEYLYNLRKIENQMQDKIEDEISILCSYILNKVDNLVSYVYDIKGDFYIAENIKDLARNSLRGISQQICDYYHEETNCYYRALHNSENIENEVKIKNNYLVNMETDLRYEIKKHFYSRFENFKDELNNYLKKIENDDIYDFKRNIENGFYNEIESTINEIFKFSFNRINEATTDFINNNHRIEEQKNQLNEYEVLNSFINLVKEEYLFEGSDSFKENFKNLCEQINIIVDNNLRIDKLDENIKKQFLLYSEILMKEMQEIDKKRRKEPDKRI